MKSGVLPGLVGLALPLLFWLFRWLQWPFWLAGFALLPLLLLRGPHAAILGPIAAVLGVLALVGQSDLPLKLYPVAVNGALLAVFAWSLRFPPSAIERLARLSEPELPPAAIAYTRRVTQVWCGFFVFNGAIALATALWFDERWWALYNGGIAYLLMGTLFAGEWLVRQRVRQRA